MAVRKRLAGAVDAHLPDVSAPRSLDGIPKAPPTLPLRWSEIGLAGEMLPDGLHPLPKPHDLAADLCIVQVHFKAHLDLKDETRLCSITLLCRSIETEVA